MDLDGNANVDRLTGVSETLLIPLACRARASREKRFKNFTDPKAEEICARFDIDLKRYAGNTPTMRGAVARGMWYDRQVLRFLEKNPGAVVFSVGSGLNTMFERVLAQASSADWRWIDSDLPDVAALRREVFSDDSRRATHIFDAVGPNWAQHEWLQNASPLLVISEAVLIYLLEDDVKSFFRSLAEFGSERSRCGILFDWCSPEMVKRSSKHPALKKLKSEQVVFRSSLRRAKDIRSYDDKWRVRSETSEVMTRSGVGPAIFSFIFRIVTLGRRLYGMAEAELLCKSKGYSA
ncbi:MAG: hypothetical protein AAF936_10470 [Pseudomonadota bacterium]